MKAELDLIRAHLESALFAAKGLPVSDSQLYLAKRLQDAFDYWVQTYRLERDREAGR